MIGGGGIFRQRIVAYIVAVFTMVFAIGLVGQTPKKAPQSAKETYTRPAPKRPIRPVIPQANRFQSDKVFLEKADSLTKPVSFNEADEHQIVKGSVEFRQGGMFMFCDSAYYFARRNSLDAFGHVRMEQGDTLFVYADKLFYDGDIRFARLRCGNSEPQVRLKNRNVVLTTDSLDYDVAANIGWYENGGKIDDGENTLTSIYGDYCPSTKEATFYHNVVLVNRKDKISMYTDTLLYNTATHVARIVSPTKIYSPSDTIITSSGWYNTATDEAHLDSRSTIFHTDTLGRVTTLEGDSIIYDGHTRISRAYMFRNPHKLPRPMVITDTARKAVLIGGYGEYNDSTRLAFATEYPLMIEYSRGDSLFLRADTILSYIELRPEKDMPGGAEDSSDKTLQEQGQTQLNEGSNDLKNSETEGNETSSEQSPSDALAPKENDKSPLKEYHVAKAYKRARFFRSNLQGVADSLTYVEYDSMLYMNVKPAVWSGNRQVYGNIIEVHFKDSTVDKAVLPDYGMLGEHVEEEFYNQLTGKKMVAYFENDDLKRMEVSGNVETIFLPQENDSSFNKLVYAQSAFLTVELDSGQLRKLKMWPDVSGTVTPIFKVKPDQVLLKGFSWYESVRPKREWYGNRWQWADDLGEIPDELEVYFSLGNGPALGRQRLVRTADSTGASQSPKTEEAATSEAEKSKESSSAEEVVDP